MKDNTADIKASIKYIKKDRFVQQLPTFTTNCNETKINAFCIQFLIAVEKVV